VLLALATSALLALILPSLATAEPTRAVLAVALLVVVVAAVGFSRSVSALAAGVLPLQARAADEDRCLRTEQATDPVHSPLRPRAPGLV